jgi:hypothetical protein
MDHTLVYRPIVSKNQTLFQTGVHSVCFDVLLICMYMCNDVWIHNRIVVSGSVSTTYTLLFETRCLRSRSECYQCCNSMLCKWLCAAIPPSLPYRAVILGQRKVVVLLSLAHHMSEFHSTKYCHLQ